MMRVLLVTCFWNEANNLIGLIESVSKQTKLPDMWYLIDDGSVNGSLEIFVRELNKIGIPFLTHSMKMKRDGNVDAIGYAFRSAPFFQERHDDFDVLIKIDGDSRLPPNYIETGLSILKRNPSLGVISGLERGGVKCHRPIGTGKFVRMDVINATVGNYWELDPDSLWNIKAESIGYDVLVIEDMIIDTVRECKIFTPDGYFMQGERMSYVGRPFVLFMASALKAVIKRRPYVLNMIKGYLSARLLKRDWHCDDPDVKYRYSLRWMLRRSK